MPNYRLLLVDDERLVLDALVRAHRKRYDISVAVGGHAGLETMERQGPFDVVVSDYQMPEMNGIAFLKKVSEVAPDSVRLMLTGNADLQTAIDAVNTGHVFRFLTKPCSAEAFVSGIDAAIEQVRLRRAEQDLLEGTLKGSIQVLSDVLSLCNPDAFGRANRIRGYVAQIVVLLKLPESWQVESAALLSQIGCVTLPSDLMERVVAGNGLPSNIDGPMQVTRQLAHGCSNKSRDLRKSPPSSRASGLPTRNFAPKARCREWSSAAVRYWPPAWSSTS